MPDPFVIAVLLTVVTCVLAFFYAPHGAATDVLNGWYEGVFKIASFAFLVALTLLIAGVGMGRVMGFTLIIFFAMCAVMGGTLLLLPHG